MGYGSDYVDELHDDLQAARAENLRLTETLARARGEGRNEGLEEAAKAVNDLDVAPIHDGVVVEVLEIIRQLKDQPNE